MKKMLSTAMIFVIVLSMSLRIVTLVEAQTDEWSEPQQLTTDPANDGIASIMQDAGGKIWLVWANMQDKTGNLWYKTSSNGGKSWSTPEILVPQIHIPRATFPSGTSLLQDSTGRIWLAWASGQLDYDIYYMTSDDGGLSWSTTQQLTDYPYDDNWPTLVEVCGKVWIIFRSFGLSSNEDIWYRKTDDGGTTWSEPIQLTSHSAMEFSNDAMVDSSGKVWLVWERGYGPGTYDLYYKTSIDHGASWSPEQQLTDLPNNEGYPSIVEDVSGKIFVFLADDDGTQQDICYRTTVDGGSTWSDFQQLTADTYKDSVPDAALINDEIWVIWQSDRSGNYDIWLAKTEVLLPAAIDVNPDSLNLWSKGKWITAYIELPEDYDVNDINVSTILLNDTISAELHPIEVGDYDNDTIPDLMVKFDRAEITSYILANLNMTELFEERFMTTTLTITGNLNDGTPFQGSDTVRVIMPMPRGRHISLN